MTEPSRPSRLGRADWAEPSGWSRLGRSDWADPIDQSRLVPAESELSWSTWMGRAEWAVPRGSSRADRANVNVPSEPSRWGRAERADPNGPSRVDQAKESQDERTELRGTKPHWQRPSDASKTNWPVRMVGRSKQADPSRTSERGPMREGRADGANTWEPSGRGRCEWAERKGPMRSG